MTISVEDLNQLKYRLKQYGFEQINNIFKCKNVLVEFTDKYIILKKNIDIFEQIAIDSNIHCNYILDRIAWIIDIPILFNENEYQQSHPDIGGYYQPWAASNNIPERRRLFHHYFLYCSDNNFIIDQPPPPPQITKTTEQKTINNTITPNFLLHVFPYEDTLIEDVSRRQKQSMLSYSANKIEQMKILSLGKTDPQIPNIDHCIINDINQTSKKCDRDYYYMGSILDYALNITQPEDYIVYTNSDCHIKKDFYNFIINSNYNCIEFFRVNVKDDIIVGCNKDGIDGFAIKNCVLQKLLKEKILPYDLIIGAPYWDAIFSGIVRKYIKLNHQDCTRLFHTEHKPRWHALSLDYGGKHNLELLNNLYDKNVINCRKAEIKSDNLVIRIFDKDTDFSQIKQKINTEKFSKNKITEFDYNYLFIEIDSGESYKSRLTDENVGTTAGTRYFVELSEVHKIIDIEKHKYKKHILLSNNEILQHSTQFIENNTYNMGVVMAFFGQDPLRIRATQRCIDALSNQSLWKSCKVVFVELVENTSNFNLSNYTNITHLKIYSKELNKNLFQKECLWNLGAREIIHKVNNFIFIDSDTYPQDHMVFAQANKALNFNPNIIFQLGNCIITQKENGVIDRIQWLWNSFAKLEAKQIYCFNPCGGLAMSKQMFNHIQGFNPFGLLYGGDILFLYEVDPRTHKIWDYIIKNMNIFKNIPRKIDTKNIILKNSECPMIHCWHGSHVDRPYHEWGLAFNNLNFIKSDIFIDHDGLLSWTNKDTMNKYAKFFQNKHKICDAETQKKIYL